MYKICFSLVVGIKFIENKQAWKYDYFLLNALNEY